MISQAPLLLWLLLQLSLALPLAANEQQAFVGATVIDGTGVPPLENAVLTIQGERIVGLTKRRETAVDAEVTQIDVAGKWIIPGLIDAHVHLFQSGGLYTRPDIIDLRAMQSYPSEIQVIKDNLEITLRRYLASGVTAILDLGGPIWNFAARDMAKAFPAAPRVAVGGPLLSTYLPAALRTRDPPIIRIESLQQARVEVRNQLAHDADLIKIWFVSPRADLAPDLAWVRAAIAEAHEAGVPVVAHATQLRVAKAVVEAGIDILAHSVDDQPVDAALLKAMRQREVIYIPTLMVEPRYRAVFDRNVALNPIERRFGDPAIIASWGDIDRLPKHLLPNWLTGTASPGLDPVMARNLKRVYAGGISVAAGSDAGNIGTLHGPSLHHELALMAEAGLDPMTILTAATQGGAAAMGRSDELGSLKSGHYADFLILDANPLIKIENTQKIWRVVKAGQLWDPDELVSRPAVP